MSENWYVLTPRQEAFLKRLTEAKERLMASIHGLTPEVTCSELIEGMWTIKDILGHIVSWDVEFRANIAAILEGRHPGYEYQISGEADFSISNQAWVEQKKQMSLEEILSEVERDYDEGAALINRLTPAEMRLRGVTPWKMAAVTRPADPGKGDTDPVATMVTFQWRHINAHSNQIEKWRKRSSRMK